MQPVAGELLAPRRLALRDLVLVVREDEVHAAAVDVEVRAEVARGHRRALDVPAGAPLAPRARPAPGVGGPLPEGEIERVLLHSRVTSTRAPASRSSMLRLRELAVAGEGADREVDVAAFGSRSYAAPMAMSVWISAIDVVDVLQTAARCRGQARRWPACPPGRAGPCAPRARAGGSPAAWRAGGSCRRRRSRCGRR